MVELGRENVGTPFPLIFLSRRLENPEEVASPLNEWTATLFPGNVNMRNMGF